MDYQANPQHGSDLQKYPASQMASFQNIPAVPTLPAACFRLLDNSLAKGNPPMALWTRMQSSHNAMGK